METAIGGQAGETKRKVFTPLWPPVVVLVLVLIPVQLLDERYRVVPRGAMTIISALSIFLLFAIFAAIWRRRERMVHWATALLLATLISLNALVLKNLIAMLFRPESIDAIRLMSSAILVWYANVLLFALAYWAIDRGGPITRANGTNLPVDFVFPEMSLSNENVRHSAPNFGDYLYVAFSTSTAFSSTDVATASTRVRVLVIVQAAISLAAVAIVAARAINIAGAP